MNLSPPVITTQDANLNVLNNILDLNASTLPPITAVGELTLSENDSDNFDESIDNILIHHSQVILKL
jgi:hypothetical protein